MERKKEEKIPYQRFELSPLFSEENEAESKFISPKERRFLKLEYMIPKVEELKDIFKQCGWEVIEEKASEKFEDGHQSSLSAEWFSVKWIR